MASDSEDLLLQLSAALASATASAQGSVVAIRAPRSPPLSGTLWRNNLVVASEQVFPRADAAEIVQTDGAAIRARVAGRDPGTNIVALQLESPIEFDRPGPADPAPRGAGTDLCCGCPGRTAGASRHRALARACLA